MPHNKSCTQCNLYPTGRPDQLLKAMLPKFDDLPLTGNSTLNMLMEMESVRTGKAPSGDILEVVETLVSVVDRAVYNVEDEEVWAQHMKMENDVVRTFKGLPLPF